MSELGCSLQRPLPRLALWRGQNRLLSFIHAPCVVVSFSGRSFWQERIIERGSIQPLDVVPSLSDRLRDDAGGLQEPRQLRRRSAQVAPRDIATPQCRPRFASALDQRRQHLPGGDSIHLSRDGNFADGCPELGAGIFAVFGRRRRCF